MSDTFFTTSPHWGWYIVFYFFVGGIAGGAFLSHRATRPLREVVATARAILRTGDLEARVPVGPSDDDLTELAHREVASLLGIRGEPVMVQLARHQAAMPQYDVGHRERIEDIERRLEPYPGLALAGNAICGIGIPSCIASGERAAKRVLVTIRRDAPKHKPVAVPV